MKAINKIVNNSESQIKVALGATSLINPLTGIGNYTLNLATVMKEQSVLEIEYFYGHNWLSNLQVIDAPKTNTIKKLIRQCIPRAYSIRRRVQQSIFNYGVKQKRIDVYHEPNFIPMDFDGPTVITVHDLSYIRFPDMHPVERIRMMNEMLPPAIKKADCIIADSYFTKTEIIDEFGVDDDKIHVTHLGKSPDFYPREQSEIIEVIQKYGLRTGEYIIAVGTIEPRKNLIQAITAYQALPDKVAKRYPLVIVGMRGWKDKGVLFQINKLISQGKAVMLGYVASGELPILYSGARALIFPSLYEGFGLPVLEAMACGTPVIASKRSSIPEVVGGAGLLIDVGDVDGMRNYIESVCLDDSEFCRLSRLGLRQAEKFSWEKCADQTYLAYLYAINHA